MVLFSDILDNYQAVLLTTINPLPVKQMEMLSFGSVVLFILRSVFLSNLQVLFSRRFFFREHLFALKMNSIHH